MTTSKTHACTCEIKETLPACSPCHSKYLLVRVRVSLEKITSNYKKFPYPKKTLVVFKFCILFREARSIKYPIVFLYVTF